MGGVYVLALESEWEDAKIRGDSEREVEGSLKSPRLTGSVYGPESRIV